MENVSHVHDFRVKEREERIKYRLNPIRIHKNQVNTFTCGMESIAANNKIISYSGMEGNELRSGGCDELEEKLENEMRGGNENSTNASHNESWLDGLGLNEEDVVSNSSWADDRKVNSIHESPVLRTVLRPVGVGKGAEKVNDEDNGELK